jgi:Cd2+/Zn2+-exporting ATPase
MSDELEKIPYLIGLSRRARRVVRQNVWFSVGWMLFLVLMTSIVGIPLPIAVVAHEGSTILVVLNGLRLLRGE